MVIGSFTTGTTPLLLCFAAASAIPCQRFAFALAFFSSSFTTQRFTASGITSYTPSSTAFCVVIFALLVRIVKHVRARRLKHEN